MTKNRKMVSKFGIVMVLLALIVLWSCLSDAFLTVNNLLLIIKQVSMYSILAVSYTHLRKCVKNYLREN